MGIAPESGPTLVDRPHPSTFPWLLLAWLLGAVTLAARRSRWGRVGCRLPPDSARWPRTGMYNVAAETSWRLAKLV